MWCFCEGTSYADLTCDGCQGGDVVVLGSHQADVYADKALDLVRKADSVHDPDNKQALLTEAQVYATLASVHQQEAILNRPVRQ